MSPKKTDQKEVFSNITTFEDLMSFLSDRGRGHTQFHHYTDLHTLDNILKGKKLYLSRADTLNDFLEGGQSSDMKNVFITSFSFFSQESIAMWSMYAWPYPDGVRLRIDGKSMRKTLREFNKNPRIYLPDDKGQTEPIGFDGKANLSLMDVAYINNKSNLEWYNYRRSRAVNACPSLTNEYNGIPGSSLLNWCFKDSIWATEIETRLILKVDPSLHDVSPDKNITKLAIDFLPALEGLTVMSGPCLALSRLEDTLEKHSDIKVHAIPSMYYNGTFFKSCKKDKDKCKYRTPFCMKRF